MCVLLVTCAVVVALALGADKPTLRKQVAWIVAPKHTGEVRVQVGDVVQIESQRLPVIPMHLGKRFSAKQNGRALHTIGRLPPAGEGSFHTSFYYKASAVGQSTVTVSLRDAEGKELQSWDYVVVVEQAKG
jgi:hypothetical protein